MYCNYCGAVNPEDSSFCRACGRALEAVPLRTDPQAPALDQSQLSDAHESRPAKLLPRIWPLLFIAVLSFLVGGVELSREPELNDLIRVLVPVSGFCYWLYCVRRFHVAVSVVPGWTHPISPSRAVWMHLIPLYNFYWIFKWPAELSKFARWKLRSGAMSKYEVGIMLLFGGLVGRVTHPSVGLVFLFITAMYVSNNLEKSIESSASYPDGNPNELENGAGGQS